MSKYDLRMGTDERFCADVLVKIVEFYLYAKDIDAHELDTMLLNWNSGDISGIIADYPEFEEKIKDL